MAQIASFNCTMRKEIPEGRWIYSMLMPDIEEEIIGDRYLEAERMERIRLKGTA